MVYKVTVSKFEKDNLKGLASVIFDDKFVVNNIKIFEGKDGLWVAMPSYKAKDDEYKDIAHPITAEFREELYKAILDAYEKAE